MPPDMVTIRRANPENHPSSDGSAKVIFLKRSTPLAKNWHRQCHIRTPLKNPFVTSPQIQFAGTCQPNIRSIVIRQTRTAGHVQNRRPVHSVNCLDQQVLGVVQADHQPFSFVLLKLDLFPKYVSKLISPQSGGDPIGILTSQHASRLFQLLISDQKIGQNRRIDNNHRLPSFFARSISPGVMNRVIPFRNCVTRAIISSARSALALGLSRDSTRSTSSAITSWFKLRRFLSACSFSCTWSSFGTFRIVNVAMTAE